MEEGILELLLVNAEGIRHTNLIGRPAYYVLVQCGTQVCRSKTTSGYAHKAFWNQKFRFEFPLSEWKNLEHLKIRIMDKELLTEGGFVGQAIISLTGLIIEGEDNGLVELQPALYSVVLEDNTYKGEVKIGMKFTVKKVVDHAQKREQAVQTMETRRSICSILLDFLKIPWLKFFCQNGRTSEDKQKL